MFIIGEKINGMFKSVAAAINARDEEVIKNLALGQTSAGADAIDINVGPSSSLPPSEILPWLIEAILKAGIPDLRISIDTSNYEVMKKSALFVKEKRGAGLCGKPILNSTTSDISRLKPMVELALETDSELIILAMDSKGIPDDKDKKLEMVASALEIATSSGMSVTDIYIDPVVMPVAFNQKNPGATLEFIKEVKILSDPPPRTIIGLSNVSQSAAKNYRGLLNRTFISMALASGLDAAILDPLDKEVIAEVAAAEILLNKTIYCESFIDSFLVSRRKNK